MVGDDMIIELLVHGYPFGEAAFDSHNILPAEAGLEVHQVVGSEIVVEVEEDIHPAAEFVRAGHVAGISCQGRCVRLVLGEWEPVGLEGLATVERGTGFGTQVAKIVVDAHSEQRTGRDAPGGHGYLVDLECLGSLYDLEWGLGYHGTHAAPEGLGTKDDVADAPDKHAQEEEQRRVEGEEDSQSGMWILGEGYEWQLG